MRLPGRRSLPILAVAGAVLFFFVFGSLARHGPSPRLAGTAVGARADRAEAVVAEVVDGDTIRLDDGTRVRLGQIDAPEAEAECYGAQAGRVLRALLPITTQVTLETDPALDRVDRFGRLLAYVFKDRLNVNLELVRRGAAAPYFYGGARGRYAAQLLAAARRAKAERQGLWGACPRTRLEPGRAVATHP